MDNNSTVRGIMRRSIILLLHLAVQLDLRTVADKLFSIFTVHFKKFVYGDSLVLLVQLSCFQTLSWS